MRTIEYDLTIGDMAALANFHAAHSRRERRRYLVVRIILAIIVLLMAASTVAGVVSGGRPDSLVTAIFSFSPLICPAILLVLVLSPALRRWGVDRAVRRAFADAPDPNAVGRQSLSVDGSGLSLKTNAADAAIPWSDVRQITTGAEGIFVLTESDQAFVVPRSAFADQLGFDAFAESLETYRQAAAGPVPA